MSRLLKKFFATLLVTMSVVAVAQTPQQKIVIGTIQTEGKTHYEITGDLVFFGYNMVNGTVILCFGASSVVGLPELGPSDLIFKDSFDRNPCLP